MTHIPYGRHLVTEEDIAAVSEVLRSDWLTTGPFVERFENALCETVEATHAVAVSSGTAGLHAAMFALGIGPGDEVIVPPMTFAATANCVVYQGGTPVFCDVEAGSLLLDPSLVEAKITPRTKAILCVDYAGQACDYDALRSIADSRELALVADSCHALGGRYKGRAVGSIADLSVFSFHPVKHITTGEGGAVTTNNAALAARLRLFRNHGITTDHRQRAQTGAWFYEMTELGYNYRISDFQCALGCSQLTRLGRGVARRQQIAALYDKAFQGVAAVRPLAAADNVDHAFHLYVARIGAALEPSRRDALFSHLREEGIGVNVHYVPVHLHPFYRQRFGTCAGLCPVAESAYQRILSLPMFPELSDADVDRVVASIKSFLGRTAETGSPAGATSAVAPG